MIFNFFAHLKTLINQYKSAVTIVLMVGLLLAVISYIGGHGSKVYIYLITLLGAVLISEFYLFIKGAGNEETDWTIKSPKNELLIIICSQVLIAALLVFWFNMAKQQVDSLALKYSLLILRLMFGFPIFLFLYFVVIKKYRLKELGITNVQSWYICAPLILLIGLMTFLMFPEGMQFQQVVAQSGILSLFLLGFLTAAIPEEVTRVLLQSRLSRVSNSQTLGWFLASSIWAVLHLPIFLAGSDAHWPAIANAVAILPIGLFWGYLNQRYKSIIPSVIIHGTNLWGLHNIF